MYRGLAVNDKADHVTSERQSVRIVGWIPRITGGTPVPQPKVRMHCVRTGMYVAVHMNSIVHTYIHALHIHTQRTNTISVRFYSTCVSTGMSMCIHLTLNCK